MSFLESVPESEEGVAAIMRRYPAQAVPMMELSELLLREGECEFSSEQRELIAAYASGINNCTYCYNTHKATAEAFGVDKQLLDAMVSDLETSAVDEKLKPVLRFVAKLTKSPSRMVQADVDAIFKAGWDEDCFHFAVMICGLFNMMNRLLDGYGVKSTAEFRLSRGKMLAESGYRAVASNTISP